MSLLSLPGGGVAGPGGVAEGPQAAADPALPGLPAGGQPAGEGASRQDGQGAAAAGGWLGLGVGGVSLLA